MGWPTEYWNPRTGSLETYKSPVPTSPEGFPDDWKDHRSGSRSDFMGIKDNPLWQVAAEANDIDFDSWYANAAAKVGDTADQEWMVQVGTDDVLQGSQANTTVVSSTPIYEQMTYREAEEKDLLDMMQGGNRWGVGLQHEGIIEDLDEMYGWMNDTIKTFKEGDYDIIREGPSGYDYGYDQEDLFEALGLNEAPQAPKALDVSYKMNLAKAKPSSAVYYTPEGYPEVNLQGD